VRHLFITLSTNNDTFKGDFKLLRQRVALLKSLGHHVDVLLFQPSLFTTSIPSPLSTSLPHEGNSLVLSYSLPVLIATFPLLLLVHLLGNNPIQTLLSRLISLQLHHCLQEFSSSYHQVHCFHFRSYHLIDKLITTRPIIFELIDSYSLNYSRLLLTRLSFLRKLFLQFEHSRVSFFELTLLPLAVNLRPVLVSSVDALAITAPSSVSSISVVPLYVDSPPYHPRPYSPRSPLRLIFFGNLDYPPNVVAINELFAIVAIIRSHFPSVKLHLTIAGRNLSKKTANAAKNISDISIVSPVIDMQELVTSHDICVLPMTSSSGLQSKLIESFSWSMPVITSPACYEALALTLNTDDVDHCFLADSNFAFASILNSIFLGEIDIHAHTSYAYRLVHDNLSFHAVSDTYHNLLCQH